MNTHPIRAAVCTGGSMTIVNGSVTRLEYGERVPVPIWLPRSEPLTARYLSARKREDKRTARRNVKVALRHIAYSLPSP